MARTYLALAPVSLSEVQKKKHLLSRCFHSPPNPRNEFEKKNNYALWGEQRFMLWFLASLGTSFCFGASNTLFKLGTTRALSSVKVQFFYYTMAFCLVLFFGIFRKELHLTFLSLSIGGLVGVLNANGNL